jgi:hypothetical protein
MGRTCDMGRGELHTGLVGTPEGKRQVGGPRLVGEG